jgi:disulfide bond formation protein DsbB
MSQQTLPDAAATAEVAEEGANGWADDLLDQLGAIARHIALLAAWIAMCGSLFFSEVLGWPPCVLCWYQRILMYPLAVILAVGILRRDRGLHLYVLPFSVVGIGVSLYHHLLIKTNWFPPPACVAGIPCTVDYLNWLGFITIPFLALVAFLIITLMMLAWALLHPAEEDLADEEIAYEDEVSAAPRFDRARLAVPMIIVAVVLAFMVGSTFV